MLELLPQKRETKPRRLQRHDLISKQRKNERRLKHSNTNENNPKDESNLNCNGLKR